MHVKKFVIGPLNTNCYVLYSSNEAVVIDPGGDPEGVINFLKGNNLHLKYVISTHGHFDHVLGVEPLKRQGAKFLLNLNDVDLMPLYYDWREMPPEPDDDLKDGYEIRVGDSVVQVLSTPGHTLGSVSMVVEDKIFTGDTLFRGTVGRYDLGGDKEKLIDSLNRIKDLKVNEVLPGHGDSTTLKEEVTSNPFLNGVLGKDDF
ncbi:MBL fold metallo-hydrolase [Metallosphaera tengchongensis]|uniref:MBL fold metallo-hydrolase n=1 Tax=Metallosphaera tengchongensis TaxID=1532350 RepID=A0A6N0NTR4_9CREN|nr:MBL fold metallo-hydrolase [Metallosphaera tengchongensis]QKR00166.1 MBL fold metallo-hydrolase [Metallosphaera tengchongensis]